MRPDGLTKKEGKVLDHLVKAYEAFGRLPEQHPSDKSEFVDAIHRLQDLLAVRIARREYPDGWFSTEIT